MKIAIIGVPLDLGAGRRGVDMGPSAIRLARLHSRLSALGHEVVDLGNVAAPECETKPAGDARIRFVDEIVAVCESVAQRTSEALEEGCFPVILGGDHSLAAGSVAGVARAHERIGLLWIDAHGDFNTPETTPSGNIHGMVLASIVGRGHDALVGVGGGGPKVPETKAALVGVRDLDPAERDALASSGLAVYTIREVDELGMKTVMERAMRRVATDVDALHLSLDMDVLDPTEAPGVGTPVRGGLSYREAHLAMEILADSTLLTSMDVVETNPVLDIENRTGTLATELVCSALGQRILH